mmetsp:Transcript_5532/g.13016  ORF Transcript_5532/g.13016 Transcript_5532/m.13016 type:complete len:84 (-) Transcript_5532:303-554(-)
MPAESDSVVVRKEVRRPWATLNNRKNKKHMTRTSPAGLPQFEEGRNCTRVPSPPRDMPTDFDFDLTVGQGRQAALRLPEQLLI